MARVKNCFLGFPSGKVGDLVFRIRNNRLFVGSAPRIKHYEPTQAQKLRRYNFSVCNAFASAVKQIDILSRRWDESDINSDNAYLKIMKLNMPAVNESGTAGLKLIPDENLPAVSMLSWDLHPDLLNVTITLPEGVNPDSGLSLQGVIILSIPTDQTRKPVKFIPVYTDRYINSDSGELIFSRILQSQESEIIKEYNERKILVNLAVKDGQGRTADFLRIIERS